MIPLRGGVTAVNEFQVAQDFIEFCQSALHVGNLTMAFQQALGNLGFRYFACGSHVDPLHSSEQVMVINYPKSWVEYYSEMRLHRIDPVFRRADRTRDPFFWDDSIFRQSITASQQRMLRSARQFGVVNGYTIPIHGPSFASATPASCSLVPDGARRDLKCYLAAQLMAQYLFDRTAQLQRVGEPIEEIPLLARRERECLELVALGKSDEDVGKVLGISPATAHGYIENAKRRFGLSSRVQAVVYAAGTRQITLGEILRPLHRLVRLTQHIRA
jgi:DNA-binding CsgD family transcriptional regulator